MPKVSKQSASHVDDHEPVEDRHEDVDGYTVTFVSFRQDGQHGTDASPVWPSWRNATVPLHLSARSQALL